MDILPNDPQFLALSREELMFLYHWKRKVTDDFKNELGVMLGARWSLKQFREQLRKRKSKKRGKSEEPEFMDIPLALLLNPNAMKMLKALMPKDQKINGESEAESVLGYDPVRKHQKKMLKEAKSILGRNS